ncbi:hypothetical protein L9F63_008727, partial [Diploptera punctata]
ASRIFLNIVNSTMGEKRNIFAYPCVKAFIDNKEIFKPKDENYKEYWIDFSLGSGYINILCDSAFFTIKETGNIWELVTIPSTLVSRAYFTQGNVIRGVSNNTQTLVLEIKETNYPTKEDILINLYPPNAKKIEIIFEDPTAINCLIQNILPNIFGNKFK